MSELKYKAKHVAKIQYVICGDKIYAVHPEYPPMWTTIDPHGWTEVTHEQPQNNPEN